MREQSEFIDKQHAEEIEKLEASLEKLHGRPFSERVYLALHARMEAAEKLAKERAEEIGRLKAEQAAKEANVEELIRASASGAETLIACSAELLRVGKQAERYEKLRVMTPVQLAFIPTRDIESPEDFDRVVDQLPASGDKP